MSRNLYPVVISCLLIYMLSFTAVADDTANKSSQTSTSDTATTTDTATDDTSTEKDETASGEDKQVDTQIDTDNKTDSTTDTATDTAKHTDIDKKLKTAILHVKVTQQGEGGLPIKDARVIITYDDATEYERKTDASGKAMLTGLPYGKVDVDVTSSGRQSDGGSLVLDEPKETLTFHLKPRNHADK